MVVEYVLVSENVAGNIHDTCRYVNAAGLAEHVVHMESNGHNSIVVFRVDRRWLDDEGRIRRKPATEDRPDGT